MIKPFVFGLCLLLLGIGTSVSAQEAPSAVQDQEATFLMNTQVKATADNLVAHFTAEGYKCDLAQQETLWVILIKKPASKTDDADAISKQVSAYVVAQGAMFNGGGIVTPGAIRLHSDAPTAATSTPVTSDMVTDQNTRHAVVLAGETAAHNCFAPGKTTKELFTCIETATSPKGATPSSGRTYFAIGANFFSSYAFDAMYEVFKKEGHDPIELE